MREKLYGPKAIKLMERLEKAARAYFKWQTAILTEQKLGRRVKIDTDKAFDRYLRAKGMLQAALNEIKAVRSARDCIGACKQKDLNIYMPPVEWIRGW